MGTMERMRRDCWIEYLNEPGLTRGVAGHRVLEAYSAGYSRADVAEFLRCSVGYVSSLAAAGRDQRAMYGPPAGSVGR